MCSSHYGSYFPISYPFFYSLIQRQSLQNLSRFNLLLSSLRAPLCNPSCPLCYKKTIHLRPKLAFLPAKTYIRAKKNLLSEHPVPLFHLLKYTIFIFRSLLSDKKFLWRAKAQYSPCFTNSKLKLRVTNRNCLKDFSPDIFIRQQCFYIFFLKNNCPPGIKILLFFTFKSPAVSYPPSTIQNPFTGIFYPFTSIQNPFTSIQSLFTSILYPFTSI